MSATWDFPTVNYKPRPSPFTESPSKTKDATSASSTHFPRGLSPAGCVSRFTVRHHNCTQAVIWGPSRFPGKNLPGPLVIAKLLRERYLSFLPGSPSLSGFTFDGKPAFNNSLIFFPFKSTTARSKSWRVTHDFLQVSPAMCCADSQPAAAVNPALLCFLALLLSS